jgi:hypothetical protein
MFGTEPFDITISVNPLATFLEVNPGLWLWVHWLDQVRAATRYADGCLGALFPGGAIEGALRERPRPTTYTTSWGTTSQDCQGAGKMPLPGLSGEGSLYAVSAPKVDMSKQNLMVSIWIATPHQLPRIRRF